MGALLGLVFGVGLVLIWRPAGRVPARVERATLAARMTGLLAAAGVENVTPAQLLALSGLAALATVLVAYLVSGTVTVAVAFGAFAAGGPLSLLRWRARRRAAELRALWPDAVDNLVSAVRAGLTLPEALSQLGHRGPPALRRPFERFAADYRASGRFSECLDRLADYLADPVGDRIIAVLRVARDVGGADLGRLLVTLGAFLREEGRTRAELETRQGWTVNAARLAVAAPWLLLALLSLHPQTVRAYDSAAGVVVLAVGGAVSVIAYRMMKRIARLPEDRRVTP